MKTPTESKENHSGLEYNAILTNQGPNNESDSPNRKRSFSRSKIADNYCAESNHLNSNELNLKEKDQREPLMPPIKKYFIIFLKI